MRRASGHAICLLLGACSQAPAPSSQKSSEPALAPGLWEVSRSVLSQQLGGEDRDVAATLNAKNRRRCLGAPVTKADALDLALDLEGAACTPRQATFSDGRIAAMVSCTPPPTHRSNEMTVTGTYTHDRFSVEVQQMAVAVPPGQDSQTRTAVDGRHLGEC